MHLYERKKSFITFPAFEVIIINFWQIWHFDVKGTGQVGLQLIDILMETVGKFDV